MKNISMNILLSGEGPEASWLTVTRYEDGGLLYMIGNSIVSAQDLSQEIINKSIMLLPWTDEQISQRLVVVEEIPIVTETIINEEEIINV